jgi:hypothetical protein
VFYEEKLIDGVWYWRTSPDGEWILFTQEKYIAKLEREITSLREQLKESRNNVLEEAANLVETIRVPWGDHYAGYTSLSTDAAYLSSSIRALKDK